MPTIDFEVWCAACREGICENYDLKSTKYGTASFEATPCGTCMKNAHDDGLNDRQLEIDKLKETVEMLQREISSLKQELTNKDDCIT